MMKIDSEKTLFFIPTFPEISDKKLKKLFFFNPFFIIVFGEADNNKTKKKVVSIQPVTVAGKTNSKVLRT